MKRLLILEFPDTSAREQFTAWFLDGGGDQGFYAFQEMHAQAHLEACPRKGKRDWDWNRDEDAREHVIRMAEVQP